LAGESANDEMLAVLHTMLEAQNSAGHYHDALAGYDAEELRAVADCAFRGRLRLQEHAWPELQRPEIDLPYFGRALSFERHWVVRGICRIFRIGDAAGRCGAGSEGDSRRIGGHRVDHSHLLLQV